MSGTDFWGRFEHDPRHPQHVPLRAADRDRDVVADLLGAAYADGRLDREEFDERSERTSRAKTLGDLPPLVGDLVSPVAPRPPVVPGPGPGPDLRAEAERRYLAQRQHALTRWLVPTLICWLVFVMSNGSEVLTAFPWPFFVMLATGLRYLRLASHREASTAAIEAHLRIHEQRRWEVAQRARRRTPAQGPVAPFPPPAWPPAWPPSWPPSRPLGWPLGSASKRPPEPWR